ncbi:hypothetical protein B0T24DRAFT_290896 [Lasiosphaeria ovina]|uniref:C2H2-type domain-containing protein n=1 Tax=Lasiosphaeria ovina TaxID=92902 RepID=A0AAE0KD36_9PEZI|nr:hypothetical protein B0T24DRAFT_290896 [Lasiosphaeria ovina]
MADEEVLVNDFGLEWLEFLTNDDGFESLTPDPDDLDRPYLFEALLGGSGLSGQLQDVSFVSVPADLSLGSPPAALGQHFPPWTLDFSVNPGFVQTMQEPFGLVLMGDANSQTPSWREFTFTTSSSAGTENWGTSPEAPVFPGTPLAGSDLLLGIDFTQVIPDMASDTTGTPSWVGSMPTSSSGTENWNNSPGATLLPFTPPTALSSPCNLMDPNSGTVNLDRYRALAPRDPVSSSPPLPSEPSPRPQPRSRPKYLPRVQQGRCKKIPARELRKIKRPVKCAYCSLGSTYTRELKKHIRAKHKDIARELGMLEEFPCDLCARTFTRRDNLIRHLRSKHELAK